MKYSRETPEVLNKEREWTKDNQKGEAFSRKNNKRLESPLVSLSVVKTSSQWNWRTASRRKQKNRRGKGNERTGYKGA